MIQCIVRADLDAAEWLSTCTTQANTTCFPFRIVVQIEAYPPPKFSWFVNGRPVTPSQRFKINYENNLITLVIFNAQPEDSGDYILKASNDMGEVTWKTTLNVKRESRLSLPVFTSWPPMFHLSRAGMS